MTKEELEKEAKEYSDYVEYTHKRWGGNSPNYGDVETAYQKGAEPREKRIAELKAQIEKMKNCRNCKKFMIEGVCGHFLQVGWCKNWELVD